MAQEATENSHKNGVSKFLTAYGRGFFRKEFLYVHQKLASGSKM